MPKGPNGQKRPADVIGCAVLVGGIATGEVEEEVAYVAPKSEKASAGGKARAAHLSEGERQRIARAAAGARWKLEENVMSFDKKFADAFAQGLSDIKFCVRSEGISVDQLKEDALAFRDAIEGKRVKPVDGVD